VVEDEALLLFTISDDLKAAGYGVFEATSASAALKVLETEAIDILFTDVAMPGELNGLELARMAAARWPTIRLFITSGHVDLRKSPLPHGARFIPKPYSPEGLVAAFNGSDAAGTGGMDIR
jgi:DNA-binding response OmpR family regulator